VTVGAQLGGKVTHGRKDGNDFLRMMAYVVCFAAHLHQHVHHALVSLCKPAVLWVELVAQNKAQASGWLHKQNLMVGGLVGRLLSGSSAASGVY
jgi:hypothetical protein